MTHNRLSGTHPWRKLTAGLAAALALSGGAALADDAPAGAPGASLPGSGAPVEQAPPPVEMEKVAYLGVATAPLGAEMSAQLGLPRGVGMVVQAVREDSPAGKAGLRLHDVLHKLDDQLLINPDQFTTLVRLHKPDEQVTLTVIRQAKPLQIVVTLGEQEVPRALRPGTGQPGAEGMIVPGEPLRRRLKLNLDDMSMPDDVRLKLGEADRMMIFPDIEFEFDLLEDPRNLPEPHQRMMQEHRQQLKDIRARIQRLLEEHPRLVPVPGGAGDPGLGGGAHSTATAIYSDGQHQMTLTIRDGDRQFRVTDNEGKEVFAGPVNTQEQRDAVPAEFREQFEQLERSIRIEPRPAPGLPATPKAPARPGPPSTETL